MTKSTITRERIQRIMRAINSEAYDEEEIREWLSSDEIMELSRMALAAMDGEPVAYMTYKGYLLHAGDPKLAEYSEPMPLYADPRPEPISAEPVAWLLSGGGAKNVVVFDGGNAYADPLREVTPLYLHAQQPVVPETAHSSVIAEQLAHVLSGLKVTDHQRAVISCAVDRLNNVAQLLQLSPSALLVPEILDYQGAKELYNYLMTEEEINATVNGWNSCRAAMLQTKSLTSINPAPDLVSLQKKAESIIGNYPGIPDCWCRTCRPVVLNDMRFVVCPDCGNKRCPRANDHKNACTGSNEPGQEGGAYPDTPQEVKP
ncbi:hypothetical protein REY30_005361 [Klebsiella quasipneumoniae]|nr:hypothetical protein [Klebsiella quasipneumoniae]